MGISVNYFDNTDADIMNDLFEDMVRHKDSVSENIRRGKYKVSELVSKASYLSPQNQAVLLDTYPDNYIIPVVLSKSMNTSPEILLKLTDSDTLRENFNKNLPSRVANNPNPERDILINNIVSMAKKTLRYISSFETDKNSIIHILKEKEHDVPKEAKTDIKVYHDIEENLLEVCLSNKFDADSFIDSLEKYSPQQLKKASDILEDLQNKCEEIGEPRNLGLTDEIAQMRSICEEKLEEYLIQY